MSLSIEIKGLEKLDALPAKVAAAAEKALDRGAKSLLDQKTAEVAKTYKRPIPKGKNRKPKWKRSGDWQREQTIVSSEGQRTIKAVGNSEKYEARLANLPTGEDGINRTNKASENAVKAASRNLQRVIEQEFKNALG